MRENVAEGGSRKTRGLLNLFSGALEDFRLGGAGEERRGQYSYDKLHFILAPPGSLALSIPYFLDIFNYTNISPFYFNKSL